MFLFFCSIEFSSRSCFVYQLVNNLLKVCNVNQINQLEKDEDVVAQAQAIAALKALPQVSFSVTNAMNNFLSDTKVLLS